METIRESLDTAVEFNFAIFASAIPEFFLKGLGAYSLALRKRTEGQRQRKNGSG